tara:strand:- start:349 stop:645 length:297 start_codon:yes stop_codon:yes gene_type:complete
MYKQAMEFQADLLRVNDLAEELFDSKQVRITYRHRNGRRSIHAHEFFVKFYPGVFDKDGGKLLATFRVNGEQGQFLNDNIDMITEEIVKAKIEMLCLR